MNQYVSPKSSFLRDSKRADAHQEMMANPAFKAAVEAALLQYIFTLSEGDKSVAELGYVGVKVQGARGFINELLNLGIQGRPVTTLENNQLLPT